MQSLLMALAKVFKSIELLKSKLETEDDELWAVVETEVDVTGSLYVDVAERCKLSAIALMLSSSVTKRENGFLPYGWSIRHCSASAKVADGCCECL